MKNFKLLTSVASPGMDSPQETALHGRYNTGVRERSSREPTNVFLSPDRGWLGPIHDCLGKAQSAQGRQRSEIILTHLIVRHMVVCPSTLDQDDPPRTARAPKAGAIERSGIPRDNPPRPGNLRTRYTCKTGATKRGPPMADESPVLTTMRAADTPNAFDLRRIGAHPDYWYPVAWSDELKVGKVLGRRFASEPIAIYRGSTGQVFALEDRCAHRQVPLHLGVVTGDEIKCHYHGWTYCPTGKCVSVPYLGKERLPNGVKSYPAREVDGLIFVFPGDPALAEARQPKSLGASQRKDYKTRR